MHRNYFKKYFIIFLSINLFLLSSTFIHADNIIIFNSKTTSEKRTFKPSRLVVVKILPKISNPQNFLTAVDSLFIDQLGLTQNIFSYIVIDNTIYKLRDLDTSFSKITTDASAVYIAYTNQVPLQLISNLKSNYKLDIVKNGKIAFDNNKFNITEIDTNNYSSLPTPKIDISIEFTAVKYTTSPTPGGLDLVTISIKNTSDFPLYKSDPSKIIAVALDSNGKEITSDMSVNEKWYSTSRAGEIVEDKIESQGSGNITFPILVQPLPGKQTQKFSLAKTNGELIPNTSFSINLDVPNQNQKVVQVNEHVYGFINIREEPKAGNRVIGFKNTGTYLLVVQDNVGGWTKVQFDGDKSGWTVTGGIKRINY